MAGLGGAALALVVVVLSYAETFATTLAGSLGPTKLLSFVSQSEQGSAWLVAAALAAFAGVVAREADRPLGAWVALLLAIGCDASACSNRPRSGRR